jgi:hypothetical protein
VAHRKDIDNKIADLRNTIGGRVRDVAAALVAFAWSLMFPTNGYQTPNSVLWTVLVLVVAFAAAAVIVDFLEMVVSYAYLTWARRKNSSDSQEFFHPSGAWRKRVEHFAEGLFVVKILCLVVGASVLVSVLVRFLYGTK